MEYKALRYFEDLTDNNYAYHAGDKYPRKGMAVSDERIAELSGKNNKLGEAVIEVVIEPVEKAERKRNVRNGK